MPNINPHSNIREIAYNLYIQDWFDSNVTTTEEQESWLSQWQRQKHLAEYLLTNFDIQTFHTLHTRRELAQMLKILYPWQDKQCYNRAFTSMCKKRACIHIDSWLRMHYPNRYKR